MTALTWKQGDEGDTLIVIQDEADHASARRLIEMLMVSSDPKNLGKARLGEALNDRGQIGPIARIEAGRHPQKGWPKGS
jgi:hypothetical protein